LNGRRLDQRNSFFRTAHRSRVDVCIDSQSEKEIVRLAQGVELRSSIKGKVKKKNFSRGWNFSTFAAHLIEQDLF